MSPRVLTESRRPAVVEQAVRSFAAGGLAGTTVADVAAAAGISTAYVLKMFGTKEALFVAALDSCFVRIETALLVAAAAAEDEPDAILAAMGDSYAELVDDRPVLMMQVHAQSASAIPAIREALSAGLGRLTSLISERSRASDDDVQRLIAYGQLCHLIVTARLDVVAEPWARTIDHGFIHAAR